MPSCWYVSQTWGVHDHRWVAALADQGFEPMVLSLSRDSISLGDVLGEIQARDNTTPILAGPLESVTRHLMPLPNPVIGLSWGFDLADPNSSQRDLTWLTELSHLIVDSASTRAIAVAAGVEPARISTIPWGIDIEKFIPEGVQADMTDFGLPSRRPVVLSLRALEPLYRVDELIRAWPLVLRERPDALLVVGNDGPLRSEFEVLAHDLDVASDVTFIGRLDESQLAGVLRSVHTYVSTSPVDGTSVTLLQAMGCGTPVIATDTPENREWITPGVTGRVYPAGSSDALARQILESLADNDESINLTTSNARAEILTRANWHEKRRELARILSGL